jgi:hypothetical protein
VSSLLGRYFERARWEAVAQVKEEAWLARHREGPAAQLRAMEAIRASVRAVRGLPGPEERAEDLAHHVSMSARMRRADRR